MGLGYPFINLANIIEHLFYARNHDSCQETPCKLNMVPHFLELTDLWRGLYAY